MTEPFDPIILPDGDPGQSPQQMPPNEKRGCAVLIVCALLALIIGWKILYTPWLCALAFGAVFLAVGVLAAKHERRSPKPEYRIAVTCFAVGGFSAVCGIILTLERFGVKILPESKAFEDHVNSVVFIVIGIGIIAFVLAGWLHKRRWCTERVEAVCVALVDVQGRRNRSSQYPVYEFFCGGATHQMRGNTASTSANPHVGETREIYVDPEHLDEMYDPKPYCRTLIFPVLFGLFFAGIGIWVLMLPG